MKFQESSLKGAEKIVRIENVGFSNSTLRHSAIPSTITSGTFNRDWGNKSALVSTATTATSINEAMRNLGKASTSKAMRNLGKASKSNFSSNITNLSSSDHTNVYEDDISMVSIH